MTISEEYEAAAATRPLNEDGIAVLKSWEGGAELWRAGCVYLVFRGWVTPYHGDFSDTGVAAGSPNEKHSPYGDRFPLRREVFAALVRASGD